MSEMIVQHQAVVDTRQQLHYIKRKAQLTRTLERHPDLLAARALMVDQRAAKRYLKGEFAALLFGRIRKIRDLPKRLAKMANHFGQRKTTGRVICGFRVVSDRLFGYASLGKMPSGQLRLRGNAAYLLLKSLGQAQVRLPATVAQQRSVGGILHQRVFEGIGGERWLTMRYNDSSLDQFAQSVLQARRWQ